MLVETVGVISYTPRADHLEAVSGRASQIASEGDPGVCPQSSIKNARMHGRVKVRSRTRADACYGLRAPTSACSTRMFFLPCLHRRSDAIASALDYAE